VRIFVTGGSGFVGGRIIARLRSEGHSVQALARSAGSAEAVQRIGATPVRGDLADLTNGSPAWLESLEGTDAVIHAAATMEFWGPDDLFLRANHIPTVALHEAAARAGVGRFVLISAASVTTGSQRATTVDESTDPQAPNIAYSRVKLMTERAVLQAKSPMTTIALRPPFIWGAGVPALREIADLARRGRFLWLDHGRHTFDFVHVDNLTEAVHCGLTADAPTGAYCITDGTPMPVRDFFTPLLRTEGADVSGARSVPVAIAAPTAAVLDRGARLLGMKNPPPLTNWLVSIMGRDRVYDISKARQLLGYRPRVSFANGLAEMAVSRSSGDGEGRDHEEGHDRHRQLGPRPMTER